MLVLGDVVGLALRSGERVGLIEGSFIFFPLLGFSPLRPRIIWKSGRSLARGHFKTSYFLGFQYSSYLS
jgi:hypothetical protein